MLVLVKFSCLAHEKPLGAMYQCVLLVPPPASTNGRKIDASHKQVKWKADSTVKIGTEVRTLEISVDGQTLKRSRLQLFQLAVILPIVAFWPVLHVRYHRPTPVSKRQADHEDRLSVRTC